MKTVLAIILVGCIGVSAVMFVAMLGYLWEMS